MQPLLQLWGDHRLPLRNAVTAIGRINRFQGRLRVPAWTVLHHSWLAYSLAAKDFAEVRHQYFVRDVFIHALLHDIIEARFGDYCGPLKGANQTEQERMSYDFACTSLGIESMAGRVATKVAELDERSAFAEAKIVGDLECPEIKRCAAMARSGDVDVARSVRNVYYRPEHSMTPEGVLVNDYLGELGALLREAKAA